MHPEYNFLGEKKIFQAELPCFIEAQLHFFFFSEGLVFNFATLQ